LGIDWDQRLPEFVAGGVRILLVLVLALVLVRAGKRIIGRFEKRVLTEDKLGGRGASRSRTLADVSRSALATTVWTLAVLQMFPVIGVHVGPLIAGVGVAGLAIGFGAQSLVRDFLTGFFVLLEDQYAVGDYVEIEGAKGMVERFNLRLTSIRALDGTLHHISNGQIKMVGNSSAGWTKAVVDITVEYNQDIEKVEAALQRAVEELKDHPTVGPLVLGPADILGVESLADRDVVMRLAIKTAPGMRMTVARAFRGQVKKVFAEEGIAVPLGRHVLIERPPPGTEPDVKA
jgi:moderate conductance mechanosensitive channel